MLGSIFRMRPKQGRERDLLAVFEDWGRTSGPKVKGAVASYILRPVEKPAELIGVASFADRESYYANAQDPKPHRFYLRYREAPRHGAELGGWGVRRGSDDQSALGGESCQSMSSSARSRAPETSPRNN